MSETIGPWKIHASDKFYKVFRRHNPQEHKLTAKIASCQALWRLQQVFFFCKSSYIGIQVGLKLRKALTVNRVLFNCRTWHSLSDTDIKDIVLIDHKLIRQICQAQAKTQIKLLSLKPGSISLSHIISNRKINYLFEIIPREDSEFKEGMYGPKRLSWDFLSTFLGLSQVFLRTFSGISPVFLKTFPGLSQDFLRTFSWLSQEFVKFFSERFSQDILGTFSGFSEEFLRSFSGLSQDFARTFPYLSKDFLKHIFRTFSGLFRTFSGLSWDFSRTFPALFQDF